jgi:hypothetical protein
LFSFQILNKIFSKGPPLLFSQKKSSAFVPTVIFQGARDTQYRSIIFFIQQT